MFTKNKLHDVKLRKGNMFYSRAAVEYREG